MKYKIEDIKKNIAELAKDLGQTTIMEVCGTHTASIYKYGIRELMPDHIKLVSGPGCPVCVTSQSDVAAALSIAKRDDVIFTCFGDMMRVPCGDQSLFSLYESGKDIRIVTSPMDALLIAQNNPRKQTIYFGIGFETTAPLTAALIESAEALGLENLCVLSAHKTMPQAMIKLLENGSNIDALLCPGHVATIIGANAFSRILDELQLPGAIAGFEAMDIMSALSSIVHMLRAGETKCINMYPRSVAENGNEAALSLMNKVFIPCDAAWRGLGVIPDSGLGIRDCFSRFDAEQRLDIKPHDIQEAKGCICANILCGKSIPTDCENFGTACKPDSPLGACMVSSEGSCAIYYRY